ncbi:MAG: hypothetical protein IH585_03880 [Anaerolineaceae bacterium]|nr:hypothetical protein [Anaerolineaceae bacterium]
MKLVFGRINLGTVAFSNTGIKRSHPEKLGGVGKVHKKGTMAKYTDDPNSNQGANLTLWAEAIWFPSVWLTDSRTHWEPVDEDTALLYVPFDDGEENFLVRFNPNTGLIDVMESMRFREIGEYQQKMLWILRNEIKQPMDQNKVISVGSATWLDQGSPWAFFAVEEIIFNVDVNPYILQRGY